MSESPRRRLPLLAGVGTVGDRLPGAAHLGFRCNGCGDCCRTLRVAITHHDLERLVAGLGRPASTFIDWLAPDRVDMTGEPGSFVELREGRRLMVLTQRDGACHLLDGNARCRAYAQRPLDCQLYPLDVHRDSTGRVVGLARLDRVGCGDESGQIADLAELTASDERRWRELAEYQRQVARWNRLAAHRRRFHRPPGDAVAFLAFLGLAPRGSEAATDTDHAPGRAKVHASHRLGYPK